MQMYTTTMTQPDPQLFMEQYCSWEMAQKDNKWAKRNISRWRNDEYDKPIRRAERTRSGQAGRAVHQDERPHRSATTSSRWCSARARRRPAPSWWRRCPAGTTTCGPCRTGSRKPASPGAAEPRVLRPPAGRGAMTGGRSASDACIRSPDRPSLGQLHPAPPADRGAEPAGHQRGAVHRAGAGARATPSRNWPPTPTCRPRCAMAAARQLGLDDPVWQRYCTG
jgi:hypothetical protein